MASNFSLSQELRQQQRLTPMQVRYVKMLEMSAPEIEDEVQRALDEMPALEVTPDEIATIDLNLTQDGELFTESESQLRNADYNADDVIPMPYHHNRGNSAFLTDYNPLMADESSLSLIDHLNSQLDQLKLDPATRANGQYIIGSLDSNGYLTRTPQSIADDIAINEGREVDSEQINKAITLVQQLDPAGVGASNLRETLLLQLQRMERTTRSLTAIEILENYFDLFTKRNFQRIASAMGISREQLDDAVNLIVHLDPKPGSSFTLENERTHQITPDFVVEASPDGILNLTMPTRIPHLSVDATFEQEPEQNPDNNQRLEQARQFLRIKRDDARQFIQLLSMRQQTLFKVMQAIVKLQADFFLSENDADIHPMVLRDVAQLTGLDISTVSRATKDKYVATNHAIYPLKKFFNERLRPDDNDNVTSNRIIQAIRNIIDSEDPLHPLSDAKLTEQLHRQGIDIARRTLTKYRESMNIPVARLRSKR